MTFYAEMYGENLIIEEIWAFLENEKLVILKKFYK